MFLIRYGGGNRNALIVASGIGSDGPTSYRNTSIKRPGAYLTSTPNHLGAYTRGALIRGGRLFFGERDFDEV